MKKEKNKKWLNQSDLSTALNVSRMSLCRWSKEIDFPKAKNKKYNVDAVKSWILENDKTQGSGRHTEGGSISELRQTLLEQEIKLNELKISEQEGTLVKFDECRKMCIKILSPLSRRLKDLPSSMGLKCNPSDPTFAKEALRTWSDETLKLVQAQAEKLKGGK